jgi:hypothetical protein
MDKNMDKGEENQPRRRRRIEDRDMDNDWATIKEKKIKIN